MWRTDKNKLNKYKSTWIKEFPQEYEKFREYRRTKDNELDRQDYLDFCDGFNIGLPSPPEKTKKAIIEYIEKIEGLYTESEKKSIVYLTSMLHRKFIVDCLENLDINHKYTPVRRKYRRPIRRQRI